MRTRGWGRSLLPATALAAALCLPAALALPAAQAAGGGVPLTTGANDVGQQGDGASSPRHVPGPVDGPAATAVASGRDHGYLLDAQGRVWGWGANDKGQVGDGTRDTRRRPVATGLDGVVAVEAGHYHGIALRTDGSVWTWGYGGLGQLGHGDAALRTRPTRVAGLSAVAVAAGRDMSYALRPDGTVAGWGNNASGEVGDGTTTRRTRPVPVSGLQDVVELSGGRNHGMARTAGGEVWTWGDNAYGQLGDGTTTRRTTPVRVPGLAGVVALDAGAHHSLAARGDGTVLSWGRGYRGQLGLGGTASRSTPAPVPGLPPVVEVGDGRDQSFAITAAGEVWAWGQNAAGQLGDGTTTRRTSPVRLDLSGVAAVQSGSSHTVFLPDGGAGPAPAPNQPPSARFSHACAELACTLDAGGASDADGDVVAHRWELGDGTTATGVVVEHDYAAAGRYRVRLTVTDDDGAQASSSRDVVVGAAAAPVQLVGSSDANRNARSHTVALPDGVRAGDGLVLALSVAAERAVTAPAGWSPVADVADGELRTVVWDRVAADGDAGASVTVGLSGYAKAALVVTAYRGTSADVVRAAATAAQTASRAAHTTPEVDVDVSGSRLMSLWAVKSSSTTALAPPDATTVLAGSATAGSGRVVALGTDSGPLPPGAAGGLTATGDTAAGKATMLSLVVAPGS